MYRFLGEQVVASSRYAHDYPDVTWAYYGNNGDLVRELVQEEVPQYLILVERLTNSLGTEQMIVHRSLGDVDGYYICLI